MSEGCGAPEQTALNADVDTNGQVVVAGKVRGSDGPLGGAYVRLLNADGDFAGEVQASAAGDFRFYAAPGEWTVRALHRTGNGQTTLNANGPGIHELAVAVG